jgi:endonuclease III
MPKKPLKRCIGRLAKHYGKQKAPSLAGPWEMILWENVAYLADDDRRREAFQKLKKRIGTEPSRIRAAPDRALLESTAHGILAGQMAAKLRRCARVAIEQFEGDLRPVLKLPMRQASKSLQQFPGIGVPGAEKILLFTRTYPIMALDSNGVRVLLRLGFGKADKSYSKCYAQVQQAVATELKPDCDWLIQAHLLLRRHGRELCRRSKPLCGECPLAADCKYGQRELS